MKVKIFILILFSIIASNAKSQYCPLGYEERNVKCGKEIITKCVPVNYSCSQCWAVSHPPCADYKTGGLDFYSSYEKAYEKAEKEKNSALSVGNKYSCIGPDQRDYIIYLDDSKFCSTNISKVSSTTGSNNNNSNGSNINQSTDTSLRNYQTSTSNKPFPIANRDLQLQADFEFFYVQHHNAEEKLEDIKKKYPANATLYENNYRPKLLQLLNSVKSEDAKDNPSPQTIKTLAKQLDNLIEQMKTPETMGLNSSNATKIQKQQYQTEADDYLNKAQNNDQSSISKQLNLNLAQTNAIMSGNQQQVQKIQQIQNQQSQDKWELIGKDFTNLIVNIQNSNQKKHALREMRQQRSEYNFLMLTTQLLNNRIGNIYTSRYEKINRKFRRPGSGDLSDYEYSTEQSQGIAQEIQNYVRTKNMDRFFEKAGNLLDDTSLSKSETYDYYKNKIRVSSESHNLINWVYDYCMSCASEYAPAQIYFWTKDKKYKKEYDNNIKKFNDEKLLPNEALHLGYINFEKLQSKEFLGNPNPKLDIAYNLFNYVIRKNGSSYHQMNAYFYMGLIKKSQAIESADTSLLNAAILLFSQAENVSLNDFLSFKNSSSYNDNLNYYSYYVEPEYYWYLRLCIMEEKINAIAEIYKIDKNVGIQGVEDYIKLGNDYFSTK